MFLIAGQTSTTLLGRYYYTQGGSSKWMSLFVQTVDFPILFFGLFFFIVFHTKQNSNRQGCLSLHRPGAHHSRERHDVLRRAALPSDL
jgi:hypothetical protein